MKTLYHGNRHKTTEMLQEELIGIGSTVILTGQYTKGIEPVDCICPICEHRWTSTPNRLLRGTGCPSCSGRINPTLEELQQELNLLGKNFTVSGQFLRSTDKLTATCNDCGFQWRTVSLAFRRDSCKCPECRKASLPVKVKPEATARYKAEKIPQPTRSERAYTNFHNKISEKVVNFTMISDFVNYGTKIQVFCNDCETVSLRSPGSLLENGCAVCSRKVKGSVEKVQNKLNQSNRNIIVSGTYTNAFGKLDCHCTVCGCDWPANPHNLDRTGCPSCALTGYDPNKPGYLYYLRVSDDTDIYWKIGITNIGMKGRFRPADRKVIEVLYCHLFEDGFVAQKAERNILDMFSEYRAENVNLLRAGNTELFTKDVLQMNHLSSWSI